MLQSFDWEVLQTIFPRFVGHFLGQWMPTYTAEHSSAPGWHFSSNKSTLQQLQMNLNALEPKVRPYSPLPIAILGLEIEIYLTEIDAFYIVQIIPYALVMI